MLSTRIRFFCSIVATTIVLNGTTPVAAQTTAAAPVPASGASRPFTALFRDAIADFRHLGSEEAATMLVVGVLAAAATQGLDRPATALLSGSSLDEVFDAGETIGSARVQLAGALVTYAAGRALGDRTVSAIGADLMGANIVAQGMTAAIKLAARRGRPDGTQFSFPSGHTSVTFATATVLQRHLGWRVGIPAYAVASYVAASRIHEERHFLSDVAFGAVVGLVAGRTVTIGRGKATFTMAPLAMPGGAGVGLTLVQ